MGKSTIGFRLYQRCLQAGLTAGYVDLGQIGFVQPADVGDPGHQRLKARNLAAIWRNYRAAGATHLVAVGAIGSQADSGRYSGELAGSGVTLIRLRAGSDDLRLPDHVAWRGRELARTRRPPARQARPSSSATWLTGSSLTRSATYAEALGRADGGGVAIETTGRSPDESADAIARALRWLQ